MARRQIVVRVVIAIGWWIIALATNVCFTDNPVSLAALMIIVPLFEFSHSLDLPTDWIHNLALTIVPSGGPSNLAAATPSWFWSSVWSSWAVAMIIVQIQHIYNQWKRSRMK